MNTNKEIILADEVYAIVGAAMEVHSELGAGFLEAAYQEAMEIEMDLRGVPVCYGQVVVEIKAMKELSNREEAQLLNYLKATGLRVGRLINFGDPGRLDWKRLVR